MRFARVHKFAAYLLAALGLVALSTGGELGGVISVVLAATFIATWFAEGDLLHSARWVRAWNVVVVVGLAIEVLRAVFLHLQPLTAAVEFAALLQLSRLANRRTARDYQQITVLAMLHLIAATVLGGGLSYAGCFIGFVIVTPWAMTLGHLRREIEGNYLADARAGRAGVPIDVARILRSRRVVGAGLLVGSSVLAVPVFAITAVIFVVFPRIGLGIFSIRPAHANHVTGLGDEVDLSGDGTIRDDPTIVLRIEPPDLGRHPALLRSFRLRGAAFDHYDGRAWRRTRSHFPATRLEGDRGVFAIRAYPEGVGYRPYRIVVDSLDPPVVLVPDGTVALRVEPRMEAGLARYPDLTRDAADEIHYAANDDLGLVYTAYVGPPDHTPRLDEYQRADYLALPPRVSPRMVALAHQLADPYPDAVGKATAIQRHLRSFRYTLQLESGGAAQPLDDFLFRSHAGHCEYFSTALAVLLRVVGVPTRNVTGFLGGTYNRWGNFYAVRQGDAHSWVEIYDDRSGWLTFDPTPPAREVTVLRGGALAELDALIEAMRVRWRRYIVSFDLGTQARLAMRMVRLFESRQHRGVEPESPTGNLGARALAEARAWLRRGVWPWYLLGAAVMSIGIVVVRRRAKRTHDGSAASRSIQVREAVALAEALDAALSVRGHTRPRSRSPLGFATDLARLGSPLAPLAGRVASRYVAARFGEDPLAPGEYDALRRELRQAPHLTS